MRPITITIPELSLVVLFGPSDSGNSTVARHSLPRPASSKGLGRSSFVQWCAFWIHLPATSVNCHL
jgi:hypothetical protein